MNIYLESEFDIFYATELSAGFDLKITEDVKIYPNQVHIVGTGTKITGYSAYSSFFDSGFVPYIMLTIRSGLAKHGLILANQPAIIDLDYRDEIKLLLTNIGSDVIPISKGTRVAQGIIQYAYRPESITIKKEKRKGGLGSTGKE